MSMLQKVKKGLLYADWVDLISQSQLQSVTWLFCPGHSGVQGNERADELAGDAVTGDKLTFDSPLVLSTVRDYLFFLTLQNFENKLFNKSNEFL